MTIGERGRTGAGSLFERLNESQDAHSRSSAIKNLRESIKQNLNNVLNIRPGSCQSAPDMGIADPASDRISGSFLETQREEIRHCIMRYEPRISHVEVITGTQDENRLLDLRFQITAFVDMEGRRDVLEFNVQLDGCQHYRMI